MVKYITFGEYNKNYKFIFLSVFFSILYSILRDLIINIFLHYKVISNNAKDLFDHSYIINIIFFLGMFVFSLILNIYENKLFKKDLNGCELKTSNSEKGCFQNIKLNEESKQKLNNKKNLLNILITIIISHILTFLFDLNFLLIIFDYWILILLITSFINKKMFKLMTYKHHKFAIFFNFIAIFIFELISFILFMTSESGKNSIYYQRMWLILITLIIYSLLTIVYSYIYSKIELFMDLNLISFPKLFIINSILGFFINSFICLVLTFIKCSGTFKVYFCNIQEGDDYYIENYLTFFKRISLIFNDKNKSDLIFVICLIILQILNYSFYNFYFLLVLKNLYPEYFYFSNYIAFILQQIISPFNSKLSNDYYFSEGEKDYKILLAKFILYLIGYFFAFFGFLVYLEIIELNFCGFNYYLRRNIIKRSIEYIKSRNYL